MRPLLLLAAAVALVAAFTLAACGPRSGPASPDLSASGSTSAPTSRPHAANPALSCVLVPASLVNATLGTHVGDPQQGGPLDPARIPGFTCTYHQPDDVVVIVFWDPADPATFGSTVGSGSSDEPATRVPGFLDDAWSWSDSAMALSSFGARRGTLGISVLAPARVDQEKALVRKLFGEI